MDSCSSASCASSILSTASDCESSCSCSSGDQEIIMETDAHSEKTPDQMELEIRSNNLDPEDHEIQSFMEGHTIHLGSGDQDLDQQEPMVMDCHDFYARRVDSLERFRYRCQHSNWKETDEDVSLVFTKLQSDMISLMENDVSLTRQLMVLGDRISELKSMSINTRCSPTIPKSPQGLLSAASSMISLDGIDEEDLKSIDDSSLALMADAPLAPSFSDGDDEDDLDDLVEKDPQEDAPQRDYFSRQNSVLRIPIPPSRRRTRLSTDYKSCASIMKRASNGSASTTSSDGDGASSGVSTVSSASYAGWYARKRSTLNNVDRVRVVSAGTLPVAKFGFPNHTSQGSCDSGVHHLNNSLEVLDREELVFV